MKKYRILLVVRHPVGGIRTFFRYFYRAFSAERFQFTLVAPDLPETRVLLEDLEGLDLTYIHVDGGVSSSQLFKRVTGVIRRGDFDLIHSHGFTSGACAVVGATIKWIPHILTSHDAFAQGQFVGLKGMLTKVALEMLLALVDCIHCVSHDARANLLASLPLLRVFKRKVVAIPSGIEVERFLHAESRDLKGELGLPPNSFLIGFLGRFMSPKGFRYLIDALATMKGRKDLPKRPVILAFGEGGFIREEREAVEKRCLAEAVHFLPFIPDVAPALKGLDVVVMPSLWEACGLLAMEAMVAGVPLIGTNCVGLREVLSNTPATAVSPRDSAALAEALIAELRNPTKARARAFATEAASRFQVRERAAELETLMLRFLEK